MPLEEDCYSKWSTNMTEALISGPRALLLRWCLPVFTMLVCPLADAGPITRKGPFGGALELMAVTLELLVPLSLFLAVGTYLLAIRRAMITNLLASMAFRCCRRNDVISSVLIMQLQNMKKNL